MQEFTNYLESSTVHGLVYISQTKKLIRLFWIAVILFGFTAAAMLILESFQSWAESPVKTTIETMPITKLTFPKVTVCPPKNTYTDLNYDLMMLENMDLHNNTRKIMSDYAIELLHENLYNAILNNMNKLEDDDRYYNWYHGLTDIEIPAPEDTFTYRNLVYRLTTQAASGSISTQHFGEIFDANKIDPDIQFHISMGAPPNVVNNATLRNVTFQIEIEKVEMNDLSTGYDKFFFNGYDKYSIDQVDVSHIQEIFEVTETLPIDPFEVSTDRLTTAQIIRSLKMIEMPGFKIKWLWDWEYIDLYDYYNLNSSEELENYYTNEESYEFLFTKRIAFIRIVLIQINFCSQINIVE